MMAWSLGCRHRELHRRGGTAFTTSRRSARAHVVIEASAHVELPQIAIDARDCGVATWRSDSRRGASGQGGNHEFPERRLVGPGHPCGPDVASTSATATRCRRQAGGRCDRRLARGEHRVSGQADAGRRPSARRSRSRTPPTPASGEPQVTDGDGRRLRRRLVVDRPLPAHIAVAVDDVTPTRALGDRQSPRPSRSARPPPMSAAATDIWSSSIIAWDFGDGTPGDRRLRQPCLCDARRQDGHGHRDRRGRQHAPLRPGRSRATPRRRRPRRWRWRRRRRRRREAKARPHRHGPQAGLEEDHEGEGGQAPLRPRRRPAPAR